jgi:uncharacterized protein
MPSTLDLLKSRREEILALAAKHGVTDVRVFGSVARGEDTPNSDIDLLIDMEKNRSLLDMAIFQTDLEELLNKHIDVVSRQGIYHLLREEILGSAKEL